MGKYCVNCGKELHTGTRFCAKCGAAVLDAPANPAPAAQPKPVPPPQLKTETQAQSNVSPVAAPKRKSSEPAKSNSGRNTLCIVLSVLLVVQMAAVVLYGWPGWAVGGKEGGPAKVKSLAVLESESFTLQEGQTSIKTDSGMTVDFGCWLTGGEEVTIEKVKPSSFDSDVEIYAYNVELSSGQPGGVIELTIYYDDSGLSAEDERLAVCGKHLNEQSKQWEDVLYTVDTQTNTVHIFTDHLSTFSAFKVVNPAKRNAYISDINVYAAYMSLEQADALLKIYAAQGPSWQENVVSSYLGATGSLEYFAESNMHTLLSLGGAYDDLVSTSFQKSMTGLGISTACAQFAYDAYTNGLTSKQTAVSAMKATLNSAINFATPSIQLAYLGVGVIEIALTDVSTFAMQTRYESTKNMYDAYYQRGTVSRTSQDWLKIFKKIYKENQSNPQKALELMNAEIDRYVQEYWEVAGTVDDTWNETEGKNAKMAKAPWPNSSDRANISNLHKEALYDYLQVVFKTISRDIYFDGLSQREKELKDLARLLNTPYALIISEETEDGDKPQWAGCYGRLAPLAAGADEKAWTGKLDDKGGGTIKFTLLAHSKAGFPMDLELYKTLDDVEKGRVAMTVSIEPFMGTQQTIVLGQAGLSLDEIVGNYEVTISFGGDKQKNSVVFSKNGSNLMSADERGETIEMSYDPATGTAYNVRGDDHITVETTFVFRRENDSIKMSGEAVAMDYDRGLAQSADYEAYKTN
jgi:hypothetical protein